MTLTDVVQSSSLVVRRRFRAQDGFGSILYRFKQFSDYEIKRCLIPYLPPSPEVLEWFLPLGVPP